MKRNQAHRPASRPPIEFPEPTENEIRKEAYYLWVEGGRPEGRDLEFWQAARELLRHRHDPQQGPELAIAHVPAKPASS